MSMGKAKRYFFAIFSIIFIWSQIFAADGQWPKKMVIAVSVADIRHKPQKPQRLSYDEMDWDQTTQALFGERILASEEKNGWLSIKALDQKVYVNNGWHEIGGWIQASQAIEVQKYPSYNLIVKVPWTYVYSLTIEKEKSFEKHRKILQSVSLGTKLLGKKFQKGWWEIELANGKVGLIDARSVYNGSALYKLNKDSIREGVLRSAELLLGAPYLWGGRSFYNSKIKKQWTSIDCSSLVELCYKIHGIEVPRNSKSQYYASKKLKRAPKKGDLVFVATHGTPDSIKHVMIYKGDDMLIEAKGNLFAKKIRKVIRVTGKERFGKPVQQLKSGDKIPEGTIYFGTFLG